MDHEFISHCNLESDVDPPPTSLYQVSCLASVSTAFYSFMY